jgi:hypothetical protein
LKSEVICCSNSRNNLFQTLDRRFILAIAEKSPLKRTMVGHEAITIYPAISISFLSTDSNPAAQVMTKYMKNN